VEPDLGTFLTAVDVTVDEVYRECLAARKPTRRGETRDIVGPRSADADDPGAMARAMVGGGVSALRGRALAEPLPALAESGDVNRRATCAGRPACWGRRSPGAWRRRCRRGRAPGCSTAYQPRCCAAAEATAPGPSARRRASGTAAATATGTTASARCSAWIAPARPLASSPGRRTPGSAPTPADTVLRCQEASAVSGCCG
jgi:hypothetical protein